MNKGSQVDQPKVAAVFGVSGVGKTTVIQNAIASCGVAASHIQASKLLKSTFKTQPSSDELRTSSEPTILSNQDALVTAFETFLLDCDCDVVVFDGHMIIDNEKKVVEVPFNTIRGLRPNLLVSVQDDPELILRRRELDQDRSRPQRQVSELAAMQARSSELCVQYAANLGIPAESINPNDVDWLAEAIRKLCRT